MDNSIATTSQDRPLITFALFAYNQEQYIEEAVRGAFSQTYSPLEIILSDDCSPDSTFDIIQELADGYDGPHKVVVNRNPENLRLAGHVNHVLGLAKGEIIVLAAGDDISFPERTTRSVEILGEDGIAVSFSTEIFQSVDHPAIAQVNQKSTGKVKSFDRSIYSINPSFHLDGAARAFKKRPIIETFGPIDDECPTEDSVILLRALLCGPVKYCDEKMVLYRIHENNLSAPESIRKMDLQIIHRQYLVDMEKALQRGLIDSPEHSQLIAALGKRIDIKNRLRELAARHNSLNGFFQFILWSNVFSLKDKCKLIVKILLSKIGIRKQGWFR